MADVTGRVYEAFIEYLLRRAGYRDEWTEGNAPQYLYEKHREALCHQDKSICPHAEECSAHSRVNSIPYGPWYDPDFFILKESVPAACIHVTHWSNPRSSKYKFWRTIEDHFQYKTQFGAGFLSINAVFEGTPAGTAPNLLRDTVAKYPLHGWDPAIASALVSSFDASLIFPRDYEILKKFAKALPPRMPSNPKARRLAYDQTWESLYAKDSAVASELDSCVALLRKAFGWSPHPRYSKPVIRKLQDKCFEGRKRSVGVKPTLSRYRKGIQHAFILREVIGDIIRAGATADDCLWRVLTNNSRFQTKNFRGLLGLPPSVSQGKINAVFNVLADIPVRMVKRVPQFLLVKSSGVGHSAWDSDFSYFVQTVRGLDAAAAKEFRNSLEALFADYRSAQGIPDVIRDLAEPDRVRKKVGYVFHHYVGQKNKAAFIKKLSDDLLIPGKNPPHQAVAKDAHNWIAQIILVAYGLGSIQAISNALPQKFANATGEELSRYGYMGGAASVTRYLLAGVPVGQVMSAKAALSEAQFYKVIGPLFSECIWEATQNAAARTAGETEFYYRHGKAARIISSSDLEPIKFLFRREVSQVGEGPRLRGCFNQLSTQRGWGSSALTTDASGLDPKTGAVIQTQTVIGRKHIADKTRELAARLRSLHITCDSKGDFSSSPDATSHFLVVDGDWPLESKINLYEAGFEGIFEIGELSLLAEALDNLSKIDDATS
ncbi:MAG: hypothetical protein P1U82_29395 [Verrucomicrobiales bacterium]|nr:hypothetical protein [Verrucomicrobiales bacterium]